MNNDLSSVELPTDYQAFIHKSRYARYLDDKKRRESWGETVERYMTYMVGHLKKKHGYEPDAALVAEIKGAILRLEIMPSMRALMTAGEALDCDHIAGFNCSYIAVDHPRAFDEILYILMCGTGVGFSAERQYVSKLPIVPEEFHPSGNAIKVMDSKLGWAKAFKQLIAALWAGEIPDWDDSAVRPAGARLKTFGGRASGPAPLRSLYEYTVALFQRAAGRQLESIEVHDLVCKIADVVVVGGVRRSALISLSNLSDQRMRDAKSGAWWEKNPQRAMANNSVAYKDKPEIGLFMDEWIALYKSQSGERGIFNRAAAKAKCVEIGRDETHDFGTNPCGEIILRSKGFCNLTEVIARHGDTMDELNRKVRLATILGTWQSTLTNFRYIRKVWQENAEQERLLGVSITGIHDCEMLATSGWPEADRVLARRLAELRETSRLSNIHEAGLIGINPSAARTCVKPSGTVSQLVDSASGIHRRHARHYIRRVRNDGKDPITSFMFEKGFMMETDFYNPAAMVIEFPIAAPQDRKEMTAVEQLDFWKLYAVNWCDHNPSTTIYVKEHEWMAVGAWCYENFDIIGGLSFLPDDGGTYKQPPYETITKEKYEKLLAVQPKNVVWNEMVEEDDLTVGSQELACMGGVCEIR